MGTKNQSRLFRKCSFLARNILGTFIGPKLNLGVKNTLERIKHSSKKYRKIFILKKSIKQTVKQQAITKPKHNQIFKGHYKVGGVFVLKQNTLVLIV